LPGFDRNALHARAWGADRSPEALLRPPVRRNGARGTSTDQKDVRTMKTVPGSTSRPQDDVIMTLLEHHVPLSLLLDLSGPQEPESAEILAEEGAPEARWWER
jgi:hypothetical protein